MDEQFKLQTPQFSTQKQKERRKKKAKKET